MKRKLLKKCNRPLIDLPKDHPARLRFEASNKGWTQTVSPEGFVFFQTTNHKVARDFLAEKAPEIIKMDLKPSGTTCGIMHFVNPQAKMAISLCGSWVWPDADDPKRLEGGWAVTYAVAQIQFADSLQKRFVEIIKETLVVCESDFYIETE